MSWLKARKVPILLALATLIPICALSWLGARTLQQDRELGRQRTRERLEVAAGRVALDIERHLQDIEERLASGNGIRLTPDGVESPLETPILYQPVDVGLTPKPSSSLLASAEVEEFQRHDHVAAARLYRKAAHNADLGVRATALLGLGRVLRRRGDEDGALRAYDALAELDDVQVAGQPAALIGRQARCKLFEERRDRPSLAKAAQDLGASLYSGKWRIDRPTFTLYRRMVERWGGPSPPQDAQARTDAALELWQSWRRGDLPPRGRRVLQQHAPVLAVWTGTGDTAKASLSSGADLERAFRPIASAQGLALGVTSMDGSSLFGDSRTGISLTPDKTRLPFIVRATLRSEGDAPQQESVRRAVIITALSLAFGLMAAAAYGLYRATTRQLLLARQQSDFVSAVSHEFRTPLTSMRHLTELLVSRSITSEERRTQYYELLAHETERLHRMVETLLSFGRIDAGAYAWKLQPAEIDDIVKEIVDEFGREPAAATHEVICEIDEGLPSIRADREALSRALWNLLENAGKYSEAGSPIRVFARRQDDSVIIGVGDRGAGIPVGERDRIFDKFVRGAEAKRAGIRGVGIGLALVKRIVEAHGGSVRVESEPGRGSTFTLVLPCHES